MAQKLLAVCMVAVMLVGVFAEVSSNILGDDLGGILECPHTSVANMPSCCHMLTCTLQDSSHSVVVKVSKTGLQIGGGGGVQDTQGGGDASSPQATAATQLPAPKASEPQVSCRLTWLQVLVLCKQLVAED